MVAVSATSPQAGLLCAALATLGSGLGCLLLFQLGRKGGEAYVDRRMHDGSRLVRFRRWFERYGLLTVFVPVLIPAPLPTKIFILLAGAMNTGRVAFLLVVLAGRLLRYLGLAWLGWELGANFAGLLREHGKMLVAGALALFLLLYLLARFWAAQRERATITNANDVAS